VGQKKRFEVDMSTLRPDFGEDGRLGERLKKRRDGQVLESGAVDRSGGCGQGRGINKQGCKAAARD
jgi:hypothetical protein